MTGLKNNLQQADETAEWHCLADAERLAEQRLPADVWDYVAGGAGNEITMAANRAALDRIGVLPRALVDVEDCDTTCDLFGVTASMPVAVAPMAYHRLVHPAGERASAAAAARAGVPFAVSTMSSTTVEDVATAGGAVWFQLYWLRDRELVAELLGRAEDAGCTAVLLTIDVPVLGRRLRDARRAFGLPAEVHAVHLGADLHIGTVAAHTGQTFDPSLNWRDLEWIRANTSLPLVLKGVLDPRDAVRAASLGVNGIVVSNHGGRQLDGVGASAAALRAVVEQVDGRCPVLFDSGVRGGVDVLRALALGATAVLLGRPVLWGLASGGARGVDAVLRLVREELENALRLSGCPDLAAARQLTLCDHGSGRI